MVVATPNVDGFAVCADGLEVMASGLKEHTCQHKANRLQKCVITECCLERTFLLLLPDAFRARSRPVGTRGVPAVWHAYIQIDVAE